MSVGVRKSWMVGPGPTMTSKNEPLAPQSVAKQ